MLTNDAAWPTICSWTITTTTQRKTYFSLNHRTENQTQWTDSWICISDDRSIARPSAIQAIRLNQRRLVWSLAWWKTMSHLGKCGRFRLGKKCLPSYNVHRPHKGQIVFLQFVIRIANSPNNLYFGVLQFETELLHPLALAIEVLRIKKNQRVRVI